MRAALSALPNGKKYDKLFVIEVIKHWAGIGFAKNEYDWLKENLE